MVETYVSSRPYSQEHAHTLSIGCSDPRCSEDTLDFIAHHGLQRSALIIVPGSFGGLIRADVLDGWVRFLHGKFILRQAVALAHEGCGHHEENLKLEGEQVREHQLKDFNLLYSVLTDIIKNNYLSYSTGRRKRSSHLPTYRSLNGNPPMQ